MTDNPTYEANLRLDFLEWKDEEIGLTYMERLEYRNLLNAKHGRYKNGE